MSGGLRLVLVRWVRRHRVRKPTVAQYRLAQRDRWTAADENAEQGRAAGQHRRGL